MKRLGHGLLLAVLAGCSGPADDRPSAVIVTLDTTRWDAVGCFGGRPGVTPVLDALAAESVTYQQARTVAPLTLPAHSSMFTGLYPPRHRVRMNNIMPLSQAAETLAERARAAGYQTGAFVASLALDRVLGLAQGFETYNQPLRQALHTTSHFAERPAVEIVAAARRWLAERDRDRPFVL